MNDNNKRIYVISNSNTRTIDEELLKRQAMLAKKQENNKTIMAIILVIISTMCIIFLFYLLDGIGRSNIGERTTAFPVTLNERTTTSSEKVVYIPTTTVQSEATHTYKR